MCETGGCNWELMPFQLPSPFHTDLSILSHLHCEAEAQRKLKEQCLTFCLCNLQWYEHWIFQVYVTLPTDVFTPIPFLPILLDSFHYLFPFHYASHHPSFFHTPDSHTFHPLLRTPPLQLLVLVPSVGRLSPDGSPCIRPLFNRFQYSEPLHITLQQLCPPLSSTHLAPPALLFSCFCLLPSIIHLPPPPISTPPPPLPAPHAQHPSSTLGPTITSHIYLSNPTLLCKLAIFPLHSQSWCKVLIQNIDHSFP